jgi:hypothetical protein
MDQVPKSVGIEARLDGNAAARSFIECRESPCLPSSVAAGAWNGRDILCRAAGRLQLRWRLMERDLPASPLKEGLGGLADWRMPCEGEGKPRRGVATVNAHQGSSGPPATVRGSQALRCHRRGSRPRKVAFQLDCGQFALGVDCRNPGVDVDFFRDGVGDHIRVTASLADHPQAREMVGNVPIPLAAPAFQFNHHNYLCESNHL